MTRSDTPKKNPPADDTPKRGAGRPATKGKTVKLTVNISEDIHTDFLAFCKSTGRTMTGLTEILIKDFIEKERQRGSK